MVENVQGSQGPEGSPQAEATPRGDDRQSLLLQLAERTVLQAETLAREITENAKKESEAEGAKILAQYTEQAKVEAQQAIDVAQRRCETMITEATAKARADGEKMLSKAKADSEKMLSDARTESAEVLGKARSESEETLAKAQTEGKGSLGNAQVEVQAVLGRAQREALATINASQARAETTESDARLKAEFIIRQTAQQVADGIRSAILETCNNLLPSLYEIGKDTPGAAAAEQVDHPAVIETENLENGSSNGTESSSSAEADTSGQSSDRPSGRRNRSSDQGRS